MQKIKGKETQIQNEIMCQRHIFAVQHYQKEADGLCCKLRYSVEKTGSHEFVVNIEEFKQRQLCNIACDN